MKLKNQSGSLSVPQGSDKAGQSRAKKHHGARFGNGVIDRRRGSGGVDVIDVNLRIREGGYSCLGVAAESTDAEPARRIPAVR